MNEDAVNEDAVNRQARESRWVRPVGADAAEGWQTLISPGVHGWTHTGLGVAVLAVGESREIAADDLERIVVPLAGSVQVRAVDAAGAEHQATLAGRSSVFDGPTDVAFVPRGATVHLFAAQGCTVAVCGAVASEAGESLPFRHVPAQDVTVEMRGAGLASREVRNFGTPAVLEADSIIACEVLTPGGCWSSYPPHKHDVERDGEETELEEIYYFEFGVDGPPGVDREATEPHGYLRLHSADDRPLDELAEVHDGDTVLVPYGWHGPAMAPPGYDMYYLNVMAGPGGKRAWLICDEPDHAWVRQTWPDQPIDPRLPFGPRTIEGD